MRNRIDELAEGWRQQGHELQLGIGIAQGYATLGVVGFEGRFDYAAIGTVTNLAERLCATAAPWQILVSARVHSAAKEILVAEPVGELELRGLSHPARAYNVLGLDAARAPV
jgi:class 3 adenylate cyclase